MGVMLSSLAQLVLLRRSETCPRSQPPPAHALLCHSSRRSSLTAERSASSGPVRQ